MSVAMMARCLGKRGRYRAQGVENALAFMVVVRDVRVCFGRMDYEIEPVSGTGKCWVSESSVRLEDES